MVESSVFSTILIKYKGNRKLFHLTAFQANRNKFKIVEGGIPGSKNHNPGYKRKNPRISV